MRSFYPIHVFVVKHIFFLIITYRYRTWYYNFVSQDWSSGPDMSEYRYYHGCGKFMLGNQTILIVAGDDLDWSKSVEFLPLNGSEWIKGNDSN